MMSYCVKVSEKGQITLPAEVREKLNIKPGNFVQIVEEERGVYKIIPQEKGIRTLKGAVPVKGEQDFKNARNQAMEELADELPKEAKHSMREYK